MKRSFVILGAGISGLALGWFLKKEFGATIDLKIIEANRRVGGWIDTFETEGYLFDRGPHSVRTKDIAWFRDLGLEKELIFPSKRASKRYLYKEGRLLAVPNDPLSFLFSPLFQGVKRHVLRELWVPFEDEEDESIEAFFTRRFGRELTERIVDPLVSGIFAGSMRLLSVQSCFPWLKKWEKESGSLLRGMLQKRQKRMQIVTFKKGMRTLINALEDALEPHIVRQTSVQSIDLKQLCVTSEGGTIDQPDHLFSTLPAYQIAKCLEKNHLEIAEALNRIPYSSLSTVHLGFRQQVLPKQGFGYLVPTREREKILGAIWDSSVFPEQNGWKDQTRLTVMLGGINRPEILDYSDNKKISIACDAMKRHWGLCVTPDIALAFDAKSAIPQYLVGHQGRVDEIRRLCRKAHAHFHLMGTAFCGVGVGDCIRSVKNKVKEVMCE